MRASISTIAQAFQIVSDVLDSSDDGVSNVLIETGIFEISLDMNQNKFDSVRRNSLIVLWSFTLLSWHPHTGLTCLTVKLNDIYVLSM